MRYVMSSVYYVYEYVCMCMSSSFGHRMEISGPEPKNSGKED